MFISRCAGNSSLFSEWKSQDFAMSSRKKIGGGKSIQVKAISALQKYYIDEYYLIRIRDLYVHALIASWFFNLVTFSWNNYAVIDRKSSNTGGVNIFVLNRRYTIETTRCGNPFLSSETSFTWMVVFTHDGVSRGGDTFLCGATRLPIFLYL